MILEEGVIRLIEYLGNAFDKVQCPAIILQFQKRASAFTTNGLSVIQDNKSFVIGTEREVTADYFNFTTTDEEYALLNKLLHIPAHHTLKGHADCALGIVTGSNKEYLAQEKSESNEMILKGSDVYKFKAHETNNYITFVFSHNNSS